MFSTVKYERFSVRQKSKDSELFSSIDINADKLKRRFEICAQKHKKVQDQHHRNQLRLENKQKKCKAQSLNPISSRDFKSSVQALDMTEKEIETTDFRWHDEMQRHPDPRHLLYTPPEALLPGICKICVGVFNKVGMEQLPSGWSEYSSAGKKGASTTYYYHEGTAEISWTPPKGTSNASLAVFRKYGTIYQLCKCPLTYEKKRLLMTKMKAQAQQLGEERTQERRKLMLRSIHQEIRPEL